MLFLREMKRLNRHSDFFRKANANKTARGDRVIIAYEANGFLGANDLPALEWREC